MKVALCSDCPCYEREYDWCTIGSKDHKVKARNVNGVFQPIAEYCPLQKIIYDEGVIEPKLVELCNKCGGDYGQCSCD